MKKIGIVGAGQLGMMLGEAARALDVECRFLDPGDAPPSSRVGEVLKGDYDDPDRLSELAEWADVITYEFENVPVDAVAAIVHAAVDARQRRIGVGDGQDRPLPDIQIPRDMEYG